MSEHDNDRDKEPARISELLDHFVKATENKDQVTIADLLDSLDSRSHGPMLLFPAVIAISPIGMIPGMSMVTGSLIILIATQMMFFTSHPWIPKRLARFRFSREKLERGAEKTKRWIGWLEKLVYRRLEFMASGLAIYPVAFTCILLAISFFPLAFVPFGVFFPGCAVVFFALGLTARDGLLILLGLTIAAAVAVALFYFWPFNFGYS